MLFRDRPLLVEGIDADLYLERNELEDSIVAPVLGGRNVLVLGEPGSGKSTLLHKVAATLEGRGQPTVLVNAALADDSLSLLQLVDIALEERVPGALRKPVPDAGAEGAQLLAAARRLDRPKPVAILVDGLLASDIGYDLFGRLRDDLWNLRHPWVVAVRPRDSATLRTPPADAFWGRTVEIPPLSYGETDRLLRIGLDDSEYQRAQRT